MGWLGVARSRIGSWLLGTALDVLEELISHWPRVRIHVLIATKELGRVPVDVHGAWVVRVGRVGELRRRFWSGIGKGMGRCWEESLYLDATGWVQDGQGRARLGREDLHDGWDGRHGWLFESAGSQRR